MSWMSWTLLIPIGLTLYGWYLIRSLSRRREVYDLYTSIIALLQQLEDEGNRAWQKNRNALTKHTELRLLAKLAGVEKRVNLIRRYYLTPNSPFTDMKKDFVRLRRCLTVDRNLLLETETPRDTTLLRLINDMVGQLLENNYAYINEPHWRLRIFHDIWQNIKRRFTR